MTSGAHDDGELGEIFLKLGKQGSTLAGVMDAFSIAVSIGLQYGVPLETYVSKFTNLRFEPAGLTDDPDVRMSQSIMDYIFRRLALDYLPSSSARPSASTPPTSASATSRPAPTSPLVERDRLGLRGRSATRRGHRRRGADVEIIDVVDETPAAPAGRGQARPTPPPSSSRRSPAPPIDSPLCMTCGTKMRPAGSCYVCEGCGSTSGCS